MAWTQEGDIVEKEKLELINGVGGVGSTETGTGMILPGKNWRELHLGFATKMGRVHRL